MPSQPLQLNIRARHIFHYDTGNVKNVYTLKLVYIYGFFFSAGPVLNKVPGEIKRSRDLEEGGGAGPSS